MSVAHRGATNLVGIGVKPAVGIDFACVQRLGHRERLHGAARLNHIGDCAVAAAVAVGTTRIIGVVAGGVHQCQDFAGFGVQHHCAAGLGLMVNQCFVQLFISNRLDALIQRQHHILAVFRRFVARRIQAVNNIAFVVAQHHFGTVLPVQAAFARQLQAFLPFAIDIGKADYMGKQIAHGVMALAFMLKSQTFDIQGRHLLADFRRQLALQIDKIFVFAAQALGEGFHRHINQGR